ncbi:MAG TPA: hypothetical protein VFT07_00020, partial [Sphingomicrobium sp.]|nr:hypothetical protein [Sphingomicrobium sp.]
MNKNRVLLNSSNSAIALAFALAASPVMAQSTLPPADPTASPATTSAETGQGQDIVVTGSRIRR